MDDTTCCLHNRGNHHPRQCACPTSHRAASQALPSGHEHQRCQCGNMQHQPVGHKHRSSHSKGPAELHKVQDGVARKVAPAAANTRRGNRAPGQQQSRALARPQQPAACESARTSFVAAAAAAARPAAAGWTWSGPTAWPAPRQRPGRFACSPGSHQPARFARGPR